MFRSSALVTLLLATIPCIAAAQLPTPGERVRVLTNDGELVTGTVEAWTDDILRVRTGRSSRYLVNRDRIEQLEVGVGQERTPGAGLSVMAGGVLIGGIVAAAAPPCKEDCGFVGPTNRLQGLAMGALVGGIVTLPLALLAAAGARRDIWEPVELPGGATASIAFRPSPHGSRLTVSIPLRGF